MSHTKDTTNIFQDWNAVWEKRGNSYNVACNKFPYAREDERNLFIRDLDVKSGHIFVDVAAGGGYLSNGVIEKFGTNVQVIAIEPSEVYAMALNPVIQHLPSKITKFDLSNQSVDRIANLASLHHTPENHLFFEECYRVLKINGIMGIADVRKDSQVDIWLNSFVDKYNSQRHIGLFFKKGDLYTQIQTVGFYKVCERCVQYTWNFNSIEDMVWYCKTLFGLDLANSEQVHEGIREILGYTVSPSGMVRMNWELIHAFGIKQ
jgi:ubiquinone/menaquinone biosynthesis C-methylase UbiE